MSVEVIGRGVAVRGGGGGGLREGVSEEFIREEPTDGAGVAHALT